MFKRFYTEFDDQWKVSIKRSFLKMVKKKRNQQMLTKNARDVNYNYVHVKLQMQYTALIELRD